MIEHGNRWKSHRGLCVLDTVICQSDGQLRSTSLSVLTYSKVSDGTDERTSSQKNSKVYDIESYRSAKHEGFILGITTGRTTVKKRYTEFRIRNSKFPHQGTHYALFDCLHLVTLE